MATFFPREVCVCIIILLIQTGVATMLDLRLEYDT